MGKLKSLPVLAKHPYFKKHPLYVYIPDFRPFNPDHFMNILTNLPLMTFTAKALEWATSKTFHSGGPKRVNMITDCGRYSFTLLLTQGAERVVSNLFRSGTLPDTGAIKLAPLNASLR